MTAIDLFERLLDLSLSISLLILCVLLIRKPFARRFGPQAAYLLWLAPAARLFLPELAVLPAPPIENIVFVAPPTSVAFTESVSSTPFSLTFLMTAAFYLWVAGAIAWLNMMGAAQGKFQRRLDKASTPASDRIATEAQTIADDLGVKRAVAVRVLSTEDGPMTAGVLKPVIFLPAGFETDYSAAERRLALHHELAHIARGDMIAALAANIFRALQWPNPLAHLAYRAFRTDQEAACDAYVLKRQGDHPHAAHTYAAALVKSARSNAIHSAYGLTLSHPLKERLMYLKNPGLSRARSLIGSALAVTMIACGLAATASYSYAAPGDKSKSVEKKTVSKQVITVDGDEKMVIEGLEGVNVRKLVVVEKDGDKTVSIYGPDGKLLEEKKYKVGEKSDIASVIVKKGDGESETIMLSDSAHFIVNGGPKSNSFIYCNTGGEEGDNEFYSWTDEDEDDNLRIISKQIVCVNGLEDGDPATKAAALEEAIERLKAEQARAQEQREKMIRDLEEKLEELQKAQ